MRDSITDCEQNLSNLVSFLGTITVKLTPPPFFEVDGGGPNFERCSRLQPKL
jgi:hypothetical protein